MAMAPHDDIGLVPYDPHDAQHRQAGILRLTPLLRHRIYEHLGVRGYPHFERRNVRGRLLSLHGSQRTQYPTLGFHGLLGSCRIMYDEVSRLLYSTNRFSIQYNDRQSFEPLRNLRPSTCASLTFLRVILAETSCFSGEGHWGSGVTCCKRSLGPNGICGQQRHRHDKPLNSLEWALEWDSTISYLSSKLGVGTLELDVICDVCPSSDTGILAAKVATDSLMRLPRLKSCSIRLSSEPDLRLQQLADETVLRALHTIPPSSSWTPALLEQAPSASPSRLLSLPQELRLRILEYTDLVTPWNEVRWSPQLHGFIVGSTFCEARRHRNPTCPPSRHHGCRINSCDFTSTKPPPGCFCRKLHSASSSKGSCKCWAPPRALFLVCQTFYKDAQAVFYSGNRFVVFDRYSHPPWTCDPPWKWNHPRNREGDYSGPPGTQEGYQFHRFGVSRFLKDIVPTDCLRHLRFLEIVLPSWDHKMAPREGQVALQDWKKTIEWAKNHLSVGGLTVRLIAADASKWRQPRLKVYITQQQRTEVIAGYMRIIGPLAGLGELRRFYAHLFAPGRLTRGAREPVAEIERDLKERAERLVMGDRYELLYNGSAEPPKSVWQHRFQREVFFR